MDNAAFRNLLSKSSPADAKQHGDEQFKKPMLGSRARSSIPMTPRSIPGYNVKSEFARQVAEQSSGEPPHKRFRSSAAPKGTKLASGYVDRASRLRDDGAGTEDDKEKRIRALEEMLKLQQIDQETFDKLREQIGVGGDTVTTHLVKGLDFKLLDRVRRGEDVTKANTDEDANEGEVENVDVDEELERALAEETRVQTTEHEPDERDAIQQELAVVTRDEILRRLKQSRNTLISTHAPAPTPALNGKFKKVAAPAKPNKHKFIESVNGWRREVLVITKKDGSSKRKTRWLDPEDAERPTQGAWGMEIPAGIAARAAQEAAAAAADEEDDDIFQGVGADYDPLADIESDDSGNDALEKRAQDGHTEDKQPKVLTGTKRNYFNSIATDEAEEEDARSSFAKDPEILAALKRAADIRRKEEREGTSVNNEEPEQSAKEKDFLQKLKERERKDAADLDYGFGGSRFDDDEDDEDVVLEDEGGSKKAGRKRGPRKRKGDKNSVNDVMGVLEARDKT